MRKPKHLRKNEWHPEVIQEVKRLRTEHPNLGKEKVYILLNPFCLRHRLSLHSVATIGRMIANDPSKMHVFPQKMSHFGKMKPRKWVKKDRKPKGFAATHPGHCLAFDTIERIVNGCRRYIITMTDVYSRFSLAYLNRGKTEGVPDVESGYRLLRIYSNNAKITL